MSADIMEYAEYVHRYNRLYIPLKNISGRDRPGRVEFIGSHQCRLVMITVKLQLGIQCVDISGKPYVNISTRTWK